MSKRSFKNNPAMAFISRSRGGGREDVVQEDVHEAVHKDARRGAPSAPSPVEPEPSKGKRDAVKNGAGERVAKSTVRVDVHEDAHEDVQKMAREAPPRYPQEYTLRKNYTRTQGRKGCYKPRINMAFDYLDVIKKHAANEGKSTTQFINDVVMDYIERKERGR